MKKTILALAGAAVLAVFASTSAMAVPITGSIAFDGVPVLTGGGTFATDTTISMITGATVEGIRSGSYLSVPTATPVVFSTPIQFNPAMLPTNPLWSFTVGTGPGAVVFSFDASSIGATYVPAQSGDGFWNISGTGIAKITGFDATPGTYTITLSNSGGSIAFGSTARALAVPDSGSTALLLGAGLLSLGLLARRRGFAL